MSSDESVFVQAPKWHPLLSSKYTKVKPALLIGVILENDTKHTPEQFKAKKAPPREGTSQTIQLLIFFSFLHFLISTHFSSSVNGKASCPRCMFHSGQYCFSSFCNSQASPHSLSLLSEYFIFYRLTSQYGSSQVSKCCFRLC